MSSQSLPRTYTRGYTQEPSDWSVMDHINWSQPIFVEVGSGSGEWICNEAATHLQHFYIGIERTKVRSQRLLNAVTKQKLKNLVAIRADATLLIDAKFPPQSIDKLYFHFPNPWPKSRQANKRFLSGSALYVYERALKQGGVIILASNIESYVREASENLRLLGFSVTEESPPTLPRTAFEQKYIARGDKIHQISATKA